MHKNVDVETIANIRRQTWFLLNMQSWNILQNAKDKILWM